MIIIKKILFSALSIGAVAAVAVFATQAFFSDTETSTGNLFQAGSLDLKVDNTCYYNEVADGTPSCPAVLDNPDTPNFNESTIVTTWTQTDLGPIHKFFYFTDLKPGDFGEDTVSLHVIDNDAWGRLVISPPVESENGCSGDEAVVEPGCSSGTDGELRENTEFYVWLDQGAIPGFQGKGNDQTEGDNIDQNVLDGPDPEPTLISPGTIDSVGETWKLWEGLAPYRAFLDLSDFCDATDLDGDGQTGGTGACQGLAVDGRLVGSTTYYFGIGWEIPETAGNEMQGDGMTADMRFEVEQWRNNPTPFVP